MWSDPLISVSKFPRSCLLLTPGCRVKSLLLMIGFQKGQIVLGFQDQGTFPEISLSLYLFIFFSFWWRGREGKGEKGGRDRLTSRDTSELLSPQTRL